MYFSNLILKEVVVPYYEVKGIPILITSIILFFGLIVATALIPGPKVGPTPPTLTHIFWSLFTFIFLLLIVFWALYLWVRSFWWRVVQKKLDQEQYILVKEYGNITKAEVIKKILQNFSDIEDQAEEGGLVLILYKGKYLLYQKFWGTK